MVKRAFADPSRTANFGHTAIVVTLRAKQVNRGRHDPVSGFNTALLHTSSIDQSRNNTDRSVCFNSNKFPSTFQVETLQK
jgi:hypothetical protein